MSDATRSVTRLIDLDDVTPASFANGTIPKYNQQTGQFVGTLLTESATYTTPLVMADLIGIQDGANTVFQLPHLPDETWPVFVLLNGVVQRPGVDFSINGNAVSLSQAPDDEDWLSCIYRAS